MNNNSYASLRVYRDDNSLYTESGFLAVVNNCDCYLVEILFIGHGYKNAHIRFICPVMTPEPGLLDNTAGALGGWSFVLDTDDIDQIENIKVVTNRPQADLVISETPDQMPPYPPDIDRSHPDYRRYESAINTHFQLVDAVLSHLQPASSYDDGAYPRHFASPLAARFSDEQLREAIHTLQQGKTVEFRYKEYGIDLS